MPTAVVTETALPKWQRPDKTTTNLPWADIKVLDMSKYDLPGGKAALAEELRDAVHTTGFFSLVNTGFTPAEVQRQYDIAQQYFSLPEAEKGREGQLCDFTQGNYFGYRPAHHKTVRGTEVRDNAESVNIPKFIPAYASEPFHPFFEPFRDEIEAFSRKSSSIADRVFRLFALLLELPEEYFAARHAYTSPSEDHLRYMRREHVGAGTHGFRVVDPLLWSQDIAGLQIKVGETKSGGREEGGAGVWRYVPPVDGGIICNVGDTLDFWSAGYLKSTTHRVVRPPEDQAAQFRQGLFYFVRPGDDTDITPAPSPLLRRLGLVPEETTGGAPKKAVTGLEYVRERVKAYHNTTDYSNKQGKTFKIGDLEIEDEAA